MSNTNVDKETKRSIMNITIENLSGVIGDVEDKIELLGEVIKPVMKASLPTEPGEKEKEKDKSSSPLVGDLNTFIDRLISVVSKINDFCDRLEL